MSRDTEEKNFQKSIFNCLEQTKLGNQCNAMDDQNYTPMAIPYPFIAKPGDNNRFVVVKSCPNETGLFQAAKEPIIHDFSISSRILLKLEVELEYLSRPISDFYYVDKVVWENVEYDLQMMKMSIHKINQAQETEGLPGLQIDPITFKNKNTTVTIKVLKSSPNSVSLSILRFIKDGTPGAFIWRIGIQDVWGQPYFDMTFMFVIKSFIGPSYDVRKIDERFYELNQTISQNAFGLNYESMRKYKNEIDFRREAKVNLVSHKILPVETLSGT